MNPEQKRKRIETIVKAIGALVVGFVVAPFVFISIKGLIGALIALAVSFTAINFLPWFAMTVANWRLKAIKSELLKNPAMQAPKGFKVEAGVWSVKTSTGWLEIVRVK